MRIIRVKGTNFIKNGRYITRKGFTRQVSNKVVTLHNKQFLLNTLNRWSKVNDSILSTTKQQKDTLTKEWNTLYKKLPTIPIKERSSVRKGLKIVSSNISKVDKQIVKLETNKKGISYLQTSVRDSIESKSTTNKFIGLLNSKGDISNIYSLATYTDTKDVSLRFLITDPEQLKTGADRTVLKSVLNQKKLLRATKVLFSPATDRLENLYTRLGAKKEVGSRNTYYFNRY